MSRIVDKWLNHILNNLLLTQCLLCGLPAHKLVNLCEGCAADMPWAREACPRCAMPNAKAIICSACQRKPPLHERALAALWYTPPASDLILLLKFQGVLHAAPVLGSLFVQRLSEHPDPLPQAILPVPLHHSRLRQRGYNQAVEIGRVIAKALAIPLLSSGTKRVLATVPQSTLMTVQDRARNLRNAFSVTGCLHGLTHIAIIDDVMTTGATVQSLAGVLRQAGVKRVDVWVCARAV